METKFIQIFCLVPLCINEFIRNHTVVDIKAAFDLKKKKKNPCTHEIKGEINMATYNFCSDKSASKNVTKKVLLIF